MNYDHKRTAGYRYIEQETVRNSYSILRLNNDVLMTNSKGLTDPFLIDGTFE